MVEGYDSITITRSGVRINDDHYRYDGSLDDALEPIIERVQTRTRNARDDLDQLKRGGIISRFSRFFDDVRTHIPISEPYLEAIVRADEFITIGLMIEHNGVVSGGSLAFYAAIEKLTHSQVYRVRFGVPPQADC